jgi:hypothetical protein
VRRSFVSRSVVCQFERVFQERLFLALLSLLIV